MTQWEIGGIDLSVPLVSAAVFAGCAVSRCDAVFLPMSGFWVPLPEPLS